MTELYGPDPEEMKLGEIYRVVPDRENKSGFTLEKVTGDHTVSIELPKGLHKVMQVEALLLDESIEQACIARLKETMESYLDSDGFKEMVQQAFKGEEVKNT